MQPQNKKLIHDLDVLADLCSKYKNDNKAIVMTNGCFDILHSGHTYILEESKKLGDILIVAINSDKSIKKIKSEDRPIISELDRAYVLSCLTSVDHVILFDDETPEKIISKILPDILVKGSDYEGKKIAGEEILSKHNKKIILLDVISGKSSTNIIKKILKL
mgnify:FL=1